MESSGTLKFCHFFYIVAVSLLAYTLLSATGRNVAPDAVTRATVWNRYEGDLAFLGDGKVPPLDADAQALVWQGGGVLVFEWDEALPLEKVRVYIGEIGNNYEVRAYLGGRLDESGAIREPEGVQTARVEDNARVVGQWTEVFFPEGTVADNMELVALGSITFYEVEIYARGEHATAVENADWGRVKMAHRPQ